MITYNTIDLFCGCGGFSYGLEQSGLNIIGSVDIWDKAIESYQKNMPNHKALCKDLTKYSPEEFHKEIGLDKNIDIIVGGIPCQAFSMAGKRDKNDPRNSLFIEYVKYLDHFKPKTFLIENVIGMLSAKLSNNEKAIDVIMNELSKNYNVAYYKLYASDFGVPQNRRRVIIIGFRKDLNIIPTEPIKKIENESNRPPVKSILEPKESIDKKQYLSQKALDGIKLKKEKMKEKGYGFGAQMLDFDKPSYTISCRYWKDGYEAIVKYEENEVRRLTILELKRIQSFPDNYVLCGSKKEQIMQIGNAVACDFAKELGFYLQNKLNNN